MKRNNGKDIERMKILGITGQVGAGKSTILSYLKEHYHACVIQADEAGHLVMETGTDVYAQIVSYFGNCILDEQKRIDRKILGAIVFQDREKLEILNGMVHPAVKSYIQRKIQEEQEKGTAPFFVLEAALLLEESYDQICDQVWYIHVDDEKRRIRLKKSRGYTNQKIDDILKNQKKEEEFRELCQVVIDNSSEFVENTFKQIDRGLEENGFL